MNRLNLTRRYVFIVEQICRPKSQPGSANGCHGWIKYKLPDNGVEIKKSFSDLEDLPQMIRELMNEGTMHEFINHEKNDDN